MTPTLTQIRAALQNLAAKKGRPDYELCTAKEVKYAMDNGLEHHLIAELPFFEITKKIDKPLRDVVPRAYPSKEQEKELINWLENFDGKYYELANAVGCTSSSFQHIIKGRNKLTLDMYKRIMRVRSELEVAA